MKLADFGISVLARTQESGRTDDLTGTGMLVGTPKYMAPELHVGSRHAQASSDIFSLGIIAYELIMSELPYQQPAIQMMLQHETLRTTADLHQRKDLAPELAQLFERCLSVDPATRPTAHEIALALAAHRPADS